LFSSKSFAEGGGITGMFRYLSNMGQIVKKSVYKCHTVPFPRYEGESKNKKAHGNGVHCIKKYEYYKGEFFVGKYNGIGTFYFKDGSRYTGQFKDNLYNGEGSFKFKNGEVKRGVFKNGKLIKEIKTPKDN